MNDLIMNKFKKRLLLEAWLKTVVWAFTIAFTTAGVVAIACWLAGFRQLWPALISLGGVLIASVLLLYFLAFRPSEKKLARRLDSLGLDERIVTMTEYKNDDSYIARRQREDARAILNGLSAKLIKVAVSVPVIVACALSLAFGAGMFTVNAAVESPDFSPKVTLRTFTIDYKVEGNGTIVGGKALEQDKKTDDKGKEVLLNTFKQKVQEGADSAYVYAKAGEGFVFAGWSDGEINPYRIENEVKRNKTLVAVFEEIDKVEIPKEYDGLGSNSSGGGGSGGGSGGGEFEDGSYESKTDKVDNGINDYGNTHSQDSQDAVSETSGNPNISDGDKGIIGDYFDTIQP